MMVFAKDVSKLLMTVFESDGFDWSLQEGTSAGQTVPHLHLHIIPRKPNDLPQGEEWFTKVAENEHELLDSLHRKRLSIQEYNEITERLRIACLSSMGHDDPK